MFINRKKSTNPELWLLVYLLNEVIQNKMDKGQRKMRATNWRSLNKEST